MGKSHRSRLSFSLTFQPFAVAWIDAGSAGMSLRGRRIPTMSPKVDEMKQASQAETRRAGGS